MIKILNRIPTILGSRRFFWLTWAFFVFEAVWIVLSAIYPMAFDEDFHFGLIRVYSHYWLPFFSQQPPHAAAYGAVARDPSYLYHYLMSFPYRLIALFIHGQTGQIIALRLINVGLFSSGLILFRRLLQRARMSAALTNVTLLMFALIPIAAQLAAHINYDNLLFLLVAWVCLLAFDATDQIRARRPRVQTLLTLLGVCLFASLVKYAFLPIFLGVVLFLGGLTYQKFRGSLGRLPHLLWRDWRRQSTRAKTMLVVLCLLSAGMFAQRYAVNIVEYHTIVPDCGRVLNVQTCQAYSAWAYTYATHQQVLAARQMPGGVSYYNPVAYLGVWIYWMWYRLFFAINGPDSGFVNYPPLPLPSAAAALLAVGGIAMALVCRRRIFRGNPYLVLLVIVSLTYIAALLADGYAAYHYTDVLQTMNGRYLLPVLLLVGAIIGRAFSLELRQSQTRKTVLAMVALLFFLEGGGLLTFISRSDASWNWPNPTVVKVNNAARTLTKHVIVKGRSTYSTSVWIFN